MNKTKTEPYNFLSEMLQINSTNKDDAASVEERVLTPQDLRTRHNTTLNQEKVDTRVFLHAGGIFLASSYPDLLTKTVKTVVLTTAVALFPNFKLKEFWIEFGSGYIESTYLHMIFTRKLDICFKRTSIFPRIYQR